MAPCFPPSHQSHSLLWLQQLGSPGSASIHWFPLPALAPGARTVQCVAIRSSRAAQCGVEAGGWEAEDEDRIPMQHTKPMARAGAADGACGSWLLRIWMDLA